MTRNTPPSAIIPSTYEVGSGTALTWIRYGPAPGAGVNEGTCQVAPPSVLLLKRGRVPVPGLPVVFANDQPTLPEADELLRTTSS